MLHPLVLSVLCRFKLMFEILSTGPPLRHLWGLEEWEPSSGTDSSTPVVQSPRGVIIPSALPRFLMGFLIWQQNCESIFKFFFFLSSSTPVISKMVCMEVEYEVSPSLLLAPASSSTKDRLTLSALSLKGLESCPHKLKKLDRSIEFLVRHLPKTFHFYK